MVSFEESLTALENRVQSLKDKIYSDGASPSYGDRKAYDTQKKKLFLYKKQDGKCCFCEEPMYADSEFGGPPRSKVATLEHVKCRTFGGTNGLHNLTLSCNQCNGRRGTIDFKLFKSMVDEHGIVHLLQKRVRKENNKTTQTKFKFLAWALHEHYNETNVIRNNV